MLGVGPPTMHSSARCLGSGVRPAPRPPALAHDSVRCAARCLGSGVHLRWLRYLNPPGAPRNDVETKNALAVQTVKAHGVRHVDDLYSVVTARCGPVYRDCNVCDDESKYHPQGDCGFHYNAAGWDMLGTAVASAIQAVL